MTDRTVLLRDIGVNAGLPYATYLLLTYEGVPTVQALAAGAVFPVASIIYGFVRERRVQALGMIVLVATVASILATLYFTSPYFVLAKGSLFTGSLGLLMLAIAVCTSSAGVPPGEPQRRCRRPGGSREDWETEPRYRRLMHRITVVWAVALLCEASLRLILIPLLPIALFLPLSEAMWICCMALMIGWSWRNAASARWAGSMRDERARWHGREGKAILVETTTARLLHSVRNDRLLIACEQSERALAEKKMPAHFDLLIRNGTCVLPWGIEATDVGVRHGRIAALGVPPTRPRTRRSTPAACTCCPA